LLSLTVSTTLNPSDGTTLTAATAAGWNNMGCGRLKVACDDGFEVISKDQKELVSLVQWHGEHAHHMKMGEADVMKMAKHP
jgi:predicted small metal-binding protein